MSTMRTKVRRSNRGPHPTSRCAKKPKTRISRCVTAEMGQLLSNQKNAEEDVFRTPRSAPHFTRNLVSNQAPSGCNGKDAAIKRPKTRAMAPPQRVEERPRLYCQGTKRGAGLGFSRVSGESPQKIGMVGCETSRGKIRLTISAFNFPQFTHIHSRIFFTFTIKPRAGFGKRAGEYEKETHQDERRASPTLYDQNVQGTQTSPHHTSGT